MRSDERALDVRVLGGVLVRVGERRVQLSGRPLHVFCRLLVADGRGVSAERLLEDVWRGGSLGVVKTTVSRLRFTLGPAGSAIDHSAQGYVLRRDRLIVDADRFAAALDEAAQLRDPVHVLARVEDALQLWRGDPFESLDDMPWLLPQVSQLTALRNRAIDMRSQSLLATGSSPEVVHALVTLVGDDPYRETFVVALATALYRSGRQVEALRALRSFQLRLRDDLGLEPSVVLVRLEHQLLTHDPALGSCTDPTTKFTDSSLVSIDTLTRSLAGLAGAGAFDEAVRVARRALDLARVGERQRVVVQALCRLARVASLAGQGAEAIEALAEARTLARSCDDAEALAQTALAGFALGVGHVGDGSLLVELAEPLSALKRSSPTRLELLTAIVQQISLGIDTQGADRVLDEATRHFVDSHDSSIENSLHLVATAALLTGLRGHGDGGKSAEQLVADAMHLGEPSFELAARLVQLRTSMLAGRLDDVVRDLPELEGAARRSLAPAAVLRSRIAGSAVAFAQARFDGLEQQITSTLRLGRQMGVSSTDGSTHLQLLGLNVELERYAQISAFVEQARATDSRGIIWDAIDAYVTAAAGDHEAARVLLARLAETRPWDSLVGWQAVLTAALATEAAWWTGVSVIADVTGPTLDRHAGHCVVAGHSTALFGPIDRYRGIAALSSAEHERALLLLTTARSQAETGGAHLWQRWCEVDLVNAHLVRRNPQDWREASRLHQSLVHSPEVRCSPRLATQVQRTAIALSGRTATV